MKKDIKDMKASSHLRVKIRRFSLLPIALFCSLASALAGTWSGVDETVVEKYAQEHGRQAKKPFINTDQGDLLLFVFLLAGCVGGFIAGYSWKNLMEAKTLDDKSSVQSNISETADPKGER
jgi:hypothetical protein